MKKWIIFALAAVVLAACGQGPKAITEGTLRDTIFSVEPRANGTTSIWMTHDDVGVYCTLDADLGAKALELLKSPSAEVIMTYRSINNDDPEYAFFGDITGKGCAKDDGAQVYKLLSIESVAAQEG